MHIFHIALNAAGLPDECREVALNFELAAGEDLPAELPLIPPGEVVQGRDGRYWYNRDPQCVIDYFDGRGIDVPIDVEHATELKAPKGDAAPAMGWIKALSVREGGAVWGVIEWTPKGAELIKNREYRYYSTVLIYEKDSLTIRGIASVGLTNKPNLNVLALNHENKEHTMDLKALLAKLGLPETATIEQALNAIGTLQGNLQTALNRAETPSLDKFVPRGDYDAVLLRATNAETRLADQKKAELETALNAEVDAAMKAGKITPATKEFYVAMCRQDGGLEQFRKFVAAAPVVGDPSDLDTKSPEQGGKALNAEDQKVADMFGNSAEDLKKYGQA